MRNENKYEMHDNVDEEKEKKYEKKKKLCYGIKAIIFMSFAHVCSNIHAVDFK